MVKGFEIQKVLLKDIIAQLVTKTQDEKKE